ncbi:hypothetical protein [Streptomyces sp. NPDC052693]|uniref:hypothetical protein n=1 Tax=Streptomyces sp. NPDC052693 TaxID=3155814 RepID=UPI003425637F
MAADQLPAAVREFANYLDGLLARLDASGGWCAVFWQRDAEGMRACLDGREVPPWDVVESLLGDLAVRYGPGRAGPETEHARFLHAAALAAYDSRPGGREALDDRLDVMLREQKFAAERQASLARQLTSATTRDRADALRRDLAWVRDDHARATARCAELRTRMSRADRRGPRAPEGEWGEAAGPYGADGAGQDRGDGGRTATEPGSAAGYGAPGDGRAVSGPGVSVAGGGAPGGGRAVSGPGVPAAGRGAPGDGRAVSGPEVPVAGDGAPGDGRAVSGPGGTARDGAGGPEGGGRARQRTASGTEPRDAAAGGVSVSAPLVAADAFTARTAAPAASQSYGVGAAPAASDAFTVPGAAPAASELYGVRAAPVAPDAFTVPAPASAAPDAFTAPAPAPAASDAFTVPAAPEPYGIQTATPATPDGPGPASRPAPAHSPPPSTPPPGTPQPAAPRARRRRRGGARFAGAVEEDVTPGVAPAVVPPLPAPAAPAGGRTPRGARFAGAAAEVVVERPAGEDLAAAGDADRDEVARVVETLARLRGQGRSGEAHALLVEAAAWEPARFPLLAQSLHRADLGADWQTLLWEAASLPAGRLVAAADALAAAGRTGDARQLLRQGVARPPGDIGRAVLGLADEGRLREVRALLGAYVTARTPEEAARCAGPDPQRLVPLLLEAAAGVSDERRWDLVHALRVAGHPV